MMGSKKEAIKVCCALIVKNKKVLITQRSESMALPLKWEFPGGKLKHNENAEIALLREIKEELALHINIRKALTPVTHDYGHFKIELIPFLCTTQNEQPILLEHRQFYWEDPSNLMGYDWAAADIPIVKEFIDLWR